MSRIGVSVLNYGDVEATLACLRSLAAARERLPAGCELRAFVLDNGSGAEALASLASAVTGMHWVHLLHNEHNTGFAAGHNRVLREMEAAFDPDHAWLLNDDCRVDPESALALLRCAGQQGDVAIWGATLLDADGVTVQCAGGCRYSDVLTTWRAMGAGARRPEIAGMPEHPLDYVAGASLWLPAAALRAAFRPAPVHPAAQPAQAPGLLNESFFLYFEELDLARRLMPGWRMAWCRDALVAHGGPRRRRTAPRRRFAEYHANLSALKFTWLHQRGLLWLAMPARFILKLVQLLCTLRWDHLPALARANLDFLRWRTSGRP